jgi:hypothetical protein
MSRRTVDLLISWSAAIVAFVLIAVGGAAIYGGSFAKDQVSDRLGVQNITFPPLEAMSPAEQDEIGQFAGQTVDTGPEAEAYATYIGGHLAEVNDGKTYSETSSAYRAVDPEAEPELAAELGAKRETLFMGEMLRGTLLNAYGWWTVGQIAFIAGIVAAVAGVVLAILVGLGFRHARKAS